MTWAPLDAGHSAWLSWIAADGTAEFYHSLRWPGWREEARTLLLTHGITAYPFLWSQEAHHDLATTTRSPAPMTELFSLQDEFAARFAAEPDRMTFNHTTCTPPHEPTHHHARGSERIAADECSRS